MRYCVVQREIVDSPFVVKTCDCGIYDSCDKCGFPPEEHRLLYAGDDYDAAFNAYTDACDECAGNFGELVSVHFYEENL